MPLFSERPSAPVPVIVDGDTFLKSMWLDSGKDPEHSPTVFLVEQAPNVSLRTHFHRENQFQLIVRGEGTLGRHAVGALTVHYAGAYSGYGPLVAGAQGLAYFTLRPVFDTGSLTMKDDAALMKRGPKRQLHSDYVGIARDDELAARTTVEVEDLIAPQPDLIAALRYTLPPLARCTGLDPIGSAGQFWVVLAGSLRVGDRVLRPWDHVFIGGDEAPLEIVAGDDGLQVVCLQSPHKAAEYR